jgi:hypothetical protein
MRLTCRRECSRSDRPCNRAGEGRSYRREQREPVAEIAADDEKVLGVCEEWRESGRACKIVTK